MEPLSVLAIIGFGIGTIGFLASGIENAYLRIRHISQHDEIILQRRQELNAVKLGLAN